MIKRGHILSLGIAQLVCWGISFYLIGVFGDQMAVDLGWSRAVVYAGFSIALLVMGFTSPTVGIAIDRFGGRLVMSIGSVLCAIGCGLLAVTETKTLYFLAWVCLGVAMRCILYDAAFASLVRIAGPAARRPIGQITLLGGLAATAFWPIGHFLSESFGWRGALWIYAMLALLTLPMYLSLPSNRFSQEPDIAGDPLLPGTAARNGGNALQALLYALIIALGNGLHAGMSAHLINVLTDVGLGASLAVIVAAMRGVGQSTARLVEVLFGARLHPINLNLIAATMMPLSFAFGVASSGNTIAAFIFTFSYGAATGILTITRGTLPLVLFDHRVYGTLAGKLLVPSFLLSAASPLIFAFVIDAFDGRAALTLSMAVGATILVAAVVLKMTTPMFMES